MIRVKPPPQAVANEEVDGGVESGEAILLYKDKPQNAKAKFKFDAYKDPIVSKTLNELFKFKCAYCESYFGATQPVAVEHFRPKSEYTVERERKRPAYYWLAASWANLLPSCTDCNSHRTQTLADGTVQVVGKQNQFPISSEAKRAKKKPEEKKEGRLLLHPYYDHPERHLVFKEEGIVGWQRPGKKPSKKGEESIRVYALLRDGIVRSRKQLWVDLQVQMRIARRLRDQHAADPNDAGLEQDFAAQLGLLESYTSPERPYSEMARQLLEPFLRELRDS